MITRNAIRCGCFLGALALAAVSPGTGFTADGRAKNPEMAAAERLAQAKQMVQAVLDNWDFETWNQLLADNVTVNLKLGSVGVDSAGLPVAAGADLQARGREDAKKLLKKVYGELKKNVKITGEVAYGYDAMLLGELNVNVKDKPQTVPVACHLHFNPKGKIDKLVVAGMDTRPLLGLIRNAWRWNIQLEDKEDAVVIRAVAPDFGASDFDIEAQDQYVTIRASKQNEEYSRAISLGVTIDKSKVEATYGNGVLTVTAPKSTEAKSHRVPVKST